MRSKAAATGENLVASRQGDVVLVVEVAGDQGDGGPRHDLLDEDDAAAPLVAGFVADVEAQVDLLEVAVEGDGQAHARAY